jgi:signal transduction histidine kinase/ligand-binding sensor domain-containing protein/DNA-binding response OmpR family regulator
MKHTIFTFLLIFFFLFSFQTIEIYAESRINFQQISLKEGLSNSSVFDILQDKQGCLWLATGNGLDKYDGYKFTTYIHKRDDQNSLQDNTLWSLHTNDENKLWIGTSKGLTLFDKSSGTFSNFPYGKKGNKMAVNKIIELNNKILVLATNLGLFEFKLSKGYKKLNFHANASVSTLLKLDDKTILVGTSNGLYIYYPENNTFSLTDKLFDKKNINVLLRHNCISDYIWVGTEGNGLILFDIKNQSVIQKLSENNGVNHITSNFVRSLCYDNQNNLWIGTFYGLNILNQTTGKNNQYFHTDNYEGEISQSSIRSMLMDNQNGIWCGTYYGGLSYYHPSKSQFQHYYHKTGIPGLNDNILSVIKEDHLGNIWIGTNEHGINILNPQTEKFTCIFSTGTDKMSMPANSVKAILEDADKNFWIGTNGTGLYYYNTSKKHFERISFSQNQTANSRIYSLLKDPDTETLWVGTFSGLYLYNTQSKKISEFRVNGGSPLEDYQILSLFRDSKKFIWIGTNYGFFRYNTKTGFFDSNTGENLNLSLVYSFHEDQKQRVWIGTKDGLFCYNLAQNAIDKSFQQAAFPPYSIFSIEEDSKQNLWMGSSAGLLTFNTKTQKLKTYTREDGVQSNQFSPYSSFKSRTGKMYFGGINGLTSFVPEQIIENNYSPVPIIDKLTIFNKTILPNDETDILKKDIQLTREIKLKPNYNIFGLNFVVTNYISHTNNLFSYKLDGFDNEWHKTEKTFISYSNLNPGHYTFHLKSENNNGIASKGETTLKIEILPYWYQTWWAKMLFFALFVFVSISVFRFYTGRKLMAKELEFEKLDKKRISELDQSKIRFFVNISHEFRTPLTLILSPVHDILKREKNNKWLLKHLNIIEKNAERMLHLINQVLDYRKTELGAMPLYVKYAEIELSAKKCFDLFLQMANNKSFNYVFNSDIGHQKVYFDENFLERILSNLLGNAFKYTPNGGTIELCLRIKENYAHIEVTDTGYGISKDKFDKIFDRFYQEENNSQGTGIGLSLVKNLVERHHGKIMLESELDKGSTFTVLLPAKKSYYTDDELHKNDEIIKEIEEIEEVKLIGRADEEIINLENEIQSNETPENENIKQILVVEDDEEIRNYLVDQLATSYQVIMAENGKVAWSILENENNIELILSDLMMPVLDGIALCKMVKQNILFCHIPFILLTAKNDVEHQLKGLQTGADDYIGKPFVYSIIETKINNIFKQHQRIVRRYASNPELNPQELVSNKLDEEFLIKAIAIIEKNIDNENFSVEEFSSEMFMSRSGLHLKIKAITGESAGDFIRKVRLAEACKLLKEGRYNSAEISTMIGMSPVYFSATFKKHIGCRPSEYVKTLTGKQD